MSVFGHFLFQPPKFEFHEGGGRRRSIQPSGKTREISKQRFNGSRILNIASIFNSNLILVSKIKIFGNGKERGLIECTGKTIGVFDSLISCISFKF